mmetsp:Transcript_39519/g.77777  ORF Transcript_39519/g.77777 Transcript_39519/m.77777 type:complete len:120 (+) Transcript_39519:1286-1645(+)
MDYSKEKKEESPNSFTRSFCFSLVFLSCLSIYTYVNVKERTESPSPFLILIDLHGKEKRGESSQGLNGLGGRCWGARLHMRKQGIAAVVPSGAAPLASCIASLLSFCIVLYIWRRDTRR